MTEAIIPALCNNHSSIFQLRLISGRASVRTIYLWASVISSLRFRLWLEQLISLISNVTSTVSHSTSSSHQLRAALPRAAPASPEWAGLGGGSLWCWASFNINLSQHNFETCRHPPSKINPGKKERNSRLRSWELGELAWMVGLDSGELAI